MAKAEIVWTNCKVKLGDLKPWSGNPRKINKTQSARLTESFDEFSQVETIAIGPQHQVYNGHQRLSVLLEKYGKDYLIDARQSSRALTERERKKLTAFLHAGTTGHWDLDMLTDWKIPELKDWGLNSGTLKSLSDIQFGKKKSKPQKQAKTPKSKKSGNKLAILIECKNKKFQKETLAWLDSEGIKGKAIS